MEKIGLGMIRWRGIGFFYSVVSHHEMHSQLVDLWYPMRSTFLDDEDRAAYEDEAADHWLSQLGLALELISPNLSQVRVEVSEAPAHVLDVLAKSSSLISLRLYSTVHIQALVTFDETKPPHPKSDEPPTQDFWPILLSFYLTKSFEIACIAGHLSRPGCFVFGKASSFIEGKLIDHAEGMFRLQVADSITDLRNSWPTLSQLNLIEVVQWFKAISAFSPPVATTRMQRAFAAFSYLVMERELENEGELLFRAMQGLEAFYSDGIGDLRRQLSDKTQLWLGLSQSPSNLVGKLYDLRSKYVHGSASMPYAVSVEDPEEHAPTAMKEFYSGVDLATRLLVATLQKCVADGVREVQWEFTHRTINYKVCADG